jgi:hypothetical protein
MHGPTCTFWANLTAFSLKVRVTFESDLDDGNVDVIFKELVVSDALRYECEAIDCKVATGRGVLQPRLVIV